MLHGSYMIKCEMLQVFIAVEFIFEGGAYDVAGRGIDVGGLHHHILFADMLVLFVAGRCKENDGYCKKCNHPARYSSL